MKSTSMLYLGGMLLLSACNPFRSRDKVQEFMPGTYVTDWKNEFTQAKDTILIAAPSARQSEIYKITKRSYYQQTIDGRELKPQFKVQNWTGTYNAEVKTIVIDKTGRVLFFNPEKNILIEGTTSYDKIK